MFHWFLLSLWWSPHEVCRQSISWFILHFSHHKRNFRISWYFFDKYRPIMINTKIFRKQKWGKTQYLRMAIILLLEEMQWTRMIHVMQYTLILTAKGWKGIIFERYDYFVCLLYWVATITLKALHNCAPFRFKYLKGDLWLHTLFSIMIIITLSKSSHACNIIYPFFLYLFRVPSG